MGGFEIPGIKVFSLCWELYPEMKYMLKSDAWNGRINLTYDSTKNATEIMIASELAREFYGHFGKISIMPIGVNTDLFKPIQDMNKKIEIKKQYCIPLDKRIGFWGGTNHIMKGFDIFMDYASKHPDIFWIIVWKWQREVSPIPNNINYIQKVLIPQEELSKLMAISDFFLSTSRLRPYYMTEYEAMSCNVPFVLTNNIKKEFIPSETPRSDIFQQGWDRESVKNLWISKFKEYNIEYVLN
jgi:glycosyltransferase involved in cell wall biosynthesis